jgi:hypothetical protein
MRAPHMLIRKGLPGWRMAGKGGFRECGDGIIESFGGPGLFWYADVSFADFRLSVAWRLRSLEDNSGVFLHCPPLEGDPHPAIEQGYEVQIDDRGYDPEADRVGSLLHTTGAIYKRARAEGLYSNAIGAWNVFEIDALRGRIVVRVNGHEASCLESVAEKPGHIALQAHHEGSAVQFRDVVISLVP